MNRDKMIIMPLIVFYEVFVCVFQCSWAVCLLRALSYINTQPLCFLEWSTAQLHQAAGD